MDGVNIFSIKTSNKQIAELELTESSIKCIIGNDIQFDILVKYLRSYAQIRPNHILFNFFQNDQLYQVVIISKNCMNIINILDSIMKKY